MRYYFESVIDVQEGKKQPRILFTSVGRRVELVQAFRAAAHRLNADLQIIGADMTEFAPALRFCDKAVLVPRIKAPSYISELTRICAENDVDLLIPTIDTDLLLLAEHTAEFENVGTTVLVSAPEKISICRDKRKTSDYFRSVGLSAPDTADCVDDYRLGFPAFIKPFDGSSSVGAHRAESKEELEMYARQLGTYVIQPFAEGTEYTVDIFCDLDGAPVFITPRIRLAVRAGEVLKTQICRREQIVAEMLRLIADFKPRGPITVQLIRNEKAKVNQYIEINPRFGGGAPLSMKAGADAAEAVIRLLMGEKVTYQPCAAQDGLIYSRFDQSICVNPEERLAEKSTKGLRAVIFDLDDTLYPEKDYVKSGFRAVSTIIPGVQNAEEKLWTAFIQGFQAIDTVLKEEGISDETIRCACLDAYRNQSPEIRLYPGAVELLRSLREKGVKTAIITDGRPEGQRAKIKALGLESLVDKIIVTDELGGPQFRKPNDIAFRIAQGWAEVPYSRMVYVGDNPQKDFAAPDKLGMQTIYFRNLDGLYSRTCEKQRVTICDFVELADVLKKATSIS